MGEEFAGLGSKLFFFCPDNGKVVEHDLESNTDRIVRKSDEERRIDRIMSTPPESIIVPSEGGFEVVPTGFSASFTCELPDSAEAEDICDLFSRQLPDKLFDVTILERHRPRRFSDGSRLPRRIKKATTRGGCYVRDTRWKRKAYILARRSCYMKHHLKDMQLTLQSNTILLTSRGMGKSTFYNKKNLR